MLSASCGSCRFPKHSLIYFYPTIFFIPLERLYFLFSFSSGKYLEYLPMTDNERGINGSLSPSTNVYRNYVMETLPTSTFLVLLTREDMNDAREI